MIGFSFPVVPKGQVRIRVQLFAAHTREHVDRAIEAFKFKIGKQHGVLRRRQLSVTAPRYRSRKSSDSLINSFLGMKWSVSYTF